MTRMTSTAGIIYLRLSDFRDTDDAGTFTAREDELRALAAEIGLTQVTVETENDLRADGKLKSASAYKTPLKVTSGGGLITRRTNRPAFTRILLALQKQEAGVLIAGDESRISREWRDALDLLDVAETSGASVVVPGRDGGPKWVLTDGGTAEERDAFMDRVSRARAYSSDLSAKIAKGRRRWAGKSWSGGRRPFGYREDPAAPEHAKTLIIVPEEAEVLRHAADAILNKGISLRALARDLRESGRVPTVTGTGWLPHTLRDVLSKPATAGLAVCGGKTIPASWPAILDRDTWQRLNDLFDSQKHPGTGNEPKWLLSGIAACGTCSAAVKCTGSRNGGRSYQCPAGHVRRNAVASDELVAARVIALLERDGAHLLKPQPKASAADAEKLRAEARTLDRKRDGLARLFAEDILTEAGVRAERKRIDARLNAIAATLAETTDADPLPEFRDPDADTVEVWEGLRLARQRAIVKMAYVVTILPAGRKGGRKFDPESVRMTRRQQTG